MCKGLRAIVATLAAAGLIAGLGAPRDAGRGWAAEPKTFVWGKSGDADTLDVNVTGNGEAWEVAAQIISKARIVSDQEQRAKMYAQAEEMIMADFRDVLIAHAKLPLIMRKNVDGLVGQLSSMEYMETVEPK